MTRPPSLGLSPIGWERGNSAGPRESERSHTGCHPGERTPLVFVALGANLGDSKRTIIEAARELEKFSDEPLLRSSLWETSPVDCPPGTPPFVNAVVGFIPRLKGTPETLLARLQSMEKAFGRTPKRTVNESRVLDLDLIAFGSETRATNELTLPHPRAHLRRFVL